MNEQDYFLNFDPYDELHFKEGEFARIRKDKILAYKALGTSYLADEELLEIMKIEFITDDGKEVRLYYDCVTLKQMPIEWIEPA